MKTNKQEDCFAELYIQRTHPEVDDALLDNLVKNIRASGNPLKVVFFGSRQRGDHKPDSDLDLMVIEEAEDRKELEEQLFKYKAACAELYPDLNLFVRSAKEAEQWCQVENYLVTRALLEGTVLFEDNYRLDNCLAKYRQTGSVAEEAGTSHKSYDEHAAKFLRLGDEDLKCAKLLIDKEFSLRYTCFHAQQAIEKYLKAYLALHKQKFDKSHNLEELKEQIQKVAPIPRLNQEHLENITEYAIRARYSTSFTPLIDEAEAAIERAIEIREIIIEAMQGIMP